MKTPKQLKSDIQTLTTHLSQVQEGLQNRSTIKIANIGKECERTAKALRLLLKNQQMPQDYKVAIVGRFKSGKSSFVNELLNTPLASESTTPETAAITTFRYGHQVKASIRFVNKAEWDKLCALYANCCVPCDHVPVRSWPLFKARQLMRGVIETLQGEKSHEPSPSMRPHYTSHAG